MALKLPKPKTDGQKVQDLHRHFQNMEEVARLADISNADRLWDAIRSPETFNFRKKEYHSSINTLYQELTDDVPFSPTMESWLLELKSVYEKDRFGSTFVTKSNLTNYLNNVWALIDWPEGDYSTSRDAAGLYMLSGTICFVALISNISLGSLPKSLGERAIADFSQAAEMSDYASQVVRARISLVGVRQLQLSKKGYGISPVSDVLTLDERQTLLPFLMKRLNAQLPSKTDAINAVMFASSLSMPTECLAAAKKLTAIDSNFLDANYKGWSTLQPVCSDPDLVFYRAEVAPYLKEKSQ